MKVKKTTCDICGADMTRDDFRYKSRMKLKEYTNSYMNRENPEFTKWKRMDICNLCMFDFYEWVRERKKQRKH